MKGKGNEKPFPFHVFTKICNESGRKYLLKYPF